MKSHLTPLLTLGSMLLSIVAFGQNECFDFKTTCANPTVQDPFFTNTYKINPLAELSETSIKVPDGYSTNIGTSWIPIEFGECFQEGEYLTNLSVSIDLVSNVVEDIQAFLHLPNHLVAKGYPQVIRLDSLTNMGASNFYEANVDKEFSNLGQLLYGEPIKALDLESVYFDGFYTQTTNNVKPASYGLSFYLQLSNHTYVGPDPGWPSTQCVGIEIEVDVAHPRPSAASPLIETVEHLTDVYVEGNCANGLWENASILRTWQITATDGVVSTCEQNISLETIDFKNLEERRDVINDCTEPFSEDLLNHPFVNDFPCATLEELNLAACNVSITYEEIEIENECGYKKIRDWTIVNWCSGEVIYRTQIIEKIDDRGPEFIDRLYIDIDPMTCLPPTLYADDFEVFDYCNEIESATLLVPSESDPNEYESYNAMEGVESFPYKIGQSKMKFRAVDLCGNVSEEDIWIYIRDKSAPTFEYSVILDLIEETCQVETITVDQLGIEDCHDIVRVLLKMEDPNSSGEVLVFNLTNGNLPNFGIGETTVEVIVVDEYSNQTVQEVAVIANDNTYPTFPELINIDVEESSCLAPALFLEDFQITDVCGALSIVNAEVLISNDPEVYQSFDLLNNEALPPFEAGNHVLELTVTDEYGNETVQSVNLIVTDKFAPLVEAELSFEVSDLNCDLQNIEFADYKISDLCSELEEVTLTQLISTNPDEYKTFDLLTGNEAPVFELGTSIVEIFAEDVFGNVTMKEVTVLVEDNFEAVAICQDDYLIKLSENNRLKATDYDGGSYDNCGNLSSVQIRKLNACSSVDWEDELTFSSCDMGLVEVELRAVFDNSEMNTCIGKVRVLPGNRIGTESPDTVMVPDPWGNFNESGIAFKEREIIDNLSDAKVFPNPFSVTTFVEFESSKEKNLSIEIFDRSGTQIYQSSYLTKKGSNQVEINLDKKYPRGIYILILKNEDQIFRKKIEVF